MTVIAWDGATLAADKRMTDSFGMARTVTKIRRLRGSLYAATGDSRLCARLMRWAEDGMPADRFPEPADHEADRKALLIEITGQRAINQYEGGPVPVRIEDPFSAWGTGRDFALAAMSLGQTARQAVELARLFQSDCGNGVDELVL